MVTGTIDFEMVKTELQTVAHGSSHKKVYTLLYYVALLKYVTREHIKNLEFPGVEKVGTKGKLHTLNNLGYLRSANDTRRIYSATTKTYHLLKVLGHDLRLLPGVPKGTGAEIYNTDVFVQAIKLPNYYALLYPQFPKEKPYIIPDALLVLKEYHRYQLNFLEIEAEKLNWDYYLQTKFDGYKRLAKDMQVI